MGPFAWVEIHFLNVAERNDERHLTGRHRSRALPLANVMGLGEGRPEFPPARQQIE